MSNPWVEFGEGRSYSNVADLLRATRGKNIGEEGATPRQQTFCEEYLEEHRPFVSHAGIKSRGGRSHSR